MEWHYDYSVIILGEKIKLFLWYFETLCRILYDKVDSNKQDESLPSIAYVKKIFKLNEWKELNFIFI